MRNTLFLFSTLLALCPVLHAQEAITAGRAIEIRVGGVPTEEMSRVNNTYPVSASGYIRMPFIGNLKAAGLTPHALAARIEAEYRSAKIYTQPTVQVFATSDETITQNMVTVGGYVRSPGPKSYTPGMTLYQVVQAAGGANEFGAMKRVRLIRDGKLTEYNLFETKDKGVIVKPNDTIEIPQKNIFGQ